MKIKNVLFDINRNHSALAGRSLQWLPTTTNTEHTKELMSRFVLLEHTGHPDDPIGRHFDLLLEQSDACETWRLSDIPQLEGPAVVATQLPDHRLVWLDRLEGEVSGGRGFARRVESGSYVCLNTTSAIEKRVVKLTGEIISGVLAISETEAFLS
jgi:hypothetical protein